LEGVSELVGELAQVAVEEPAVGVLAQVAGQGPAAVSEAPKELRPENG
jgi:hypothetical protein